MHWISIIFIGLASNIDNLGIGVSFGTRSTKIPILSNLLIAVMAMAAAYLAISTGQILSGYMSQEYTDLIGGIVIILLGIWSFLPKKLSGVVKRPFPAVAVAASEDEKVINWKESLSLGFALSFNCLAMGFGAGVSGASAMITALSVGIFSFITVAIGVSIGHQIAKTWLGKYSTLIGGLLLIAIGVHEIFAGTV